MEVAEASATPPLAPTAVPVVGNAVPGEVSVHHESPPAEPLVAVTPPTRAKYCVVPGVVIEALTILE